MKIKVSEATGAALNWLVAQCLGDCREATFTTWTPSDNWAQGGPIIDTARISIEEASTHGGWIARTGVGIYALPTRISYSDGPTALIAAMRCYVASKLGDYADVPEELTHA